MDNRINYFNDFELALMLQTALLHDIGMALPNLKSKPIVGVENRKHPSYEIDKAISQIDEYEEWFEQEINREWLNRTYKLKVLNPIKYIIIGHSKDLSPQDRRRLRKARGTVFFTYDEFIEMDRHQIYRIR